VYALYRVVGKPAEPKPPGSEGLNNLKYVLLTEKKRDLYTWLLIDFPVREE
jgi:hypothetical protein